MGIGKDKKQPPAPDPSKTARAQHSHNLRAAKDQQRLNMVNEVTPFGTAKYKRTGTKGGVPQYTRVIKLSPEQRRLLRKEQGLNTQALDNARAATQGVVSLDSLGDAPVANDETRRRVEEALYGRYTGMLDPVYDDRMRALETRLANQGFSQGTEAYAREIENFRRAQGDAYLSAAQEATLAGGQEQSRLFGLEMDARNQAINEILLPRNQALTELGIARGGSAVTMPQFGAPPQAGVAAADITGPTALKYQAALNQYNQDQQDDRALMGAIFGLGSAALGGAMAGPMGAQMGRQMGGWAAGY